MFFTSKLKVVKKICQINNLPKIQLTLKQQKAHELAIKNQQLTYEDPETKYLVMTELYHKKRGHCCGNRCRHCPFNYINVK